MTRTEQTEAIERLRQWVHPGDVISTVLRHRARSGMSRSISLLMVHERIIDLDYNVARALNMRIDRNNGGIKISGAGMDMGFELVYQLGRALWPDGAEWHKDGGYALRQEWL